MKKSRITFLIAEISLAILAAIFISKIFLSEKPQKRIAVIVENSGDEKWNSFINGLKQAANMNNIHLIICNTDEIENADEERALVYEQLENDVDGFIIQAAPGYEVLEIMEELVTQKPVVMVKNDVLVSETDKLTRSHIELPTIMTDNYNIGYRLGEELLKDNAGDIQGMTVGIVSGLAETDSAVKRQQGLLDALEGSGCDIIWMLNRTYDRGAVTMVEAQEQADIIAVLDSEALEQLGDAAGEEKKIKSKLYGIGSSMKCVYYLDEGKLCSLIIEDDYGMGYDSVTELAHRLEHGMYTIPNITTDFRVLQKDDIFEEETQQFLYTYD